MEIKYAQTGEKKIWNSGTQEKRQGSCPQISQIDADFGREDQAKGSQAKVDCVDPRAIGAASRHSDAGLPHLK